MRHTRNYVYGLIATLAIVVPAARSDSPPSKPPADKDRPPVRLPPGHELMLTKLRHAHALLDAIAVRDFKSMASNADELARVSRAAAFLEAYQTDEYVAQTINFRRAAERIAQKARAKNIDGAMLAYLDLTMTCVKCHESTRDRTEARLPLLPRPLASR